MTKIGVKHFWWNRLFKNQQLLNAPYQQLRVFTCRNPAKRQQDIRYFIAKSRRERRTKQADSERDDDADIPVWTAPSGGNFDRPASSREAFVQPVLIATSPSDELVVGARRNIGLEIDKETESRAGADVIFSGHGGGDYNEEKDEGSSSSISSSSEGSPPSCPVGIPPSPSPSLSQEIIYSEDILAGLSLLEKSLVAELHKVRRERHRAPPIASRTKR